jgi:endonuclease/exonuclease/phosphatase family metal-dependent hydrolase
VFSADIAFDSVFKGRVLISKVNIQCFDELTLVNFHTPVTGGFSRYNLQEMFKIANEYIAKKNAIICGDLNFGECFDKNGKTEHKDILDNILNEYDIVDCYRKSHNEIGQTFRPNLNPDSLICIDYIFVTKDLEGRVKSCDIVSDEDIQTMSDHHPLVAVLE